MTVVHIVVDHAPGPGIDWEVDDGAVLALTDRQLLWMVDHFPPDRALH